MTTEVEICWSSLMINQPITAMSPDDIVFDGLKYRTKDSRHFWGHNDMQRTLTQIFPEYPAFVAQYGLNHTLVARVIHRKDRWTEEHGDWRVQLYACFENDADAVFFTIWMYSQEPPP